MEEIWKVYITVCNGKRVYEVSNKGRVKLNGVLTEPDTDQRGYKRIGSFFIHRAVAELFVPNPENKTEVDHIDTNKANNNADNLRWCTHKENCNNTLTRQHYSENNGMKNPEACKKVSESLKGRKLSDTTRQKMSEMRKGKKLSEEHKQNLKEAWIRRKQKDGQTNLE